MAPERGFSNVSIYENRDYFKRQIDSDYLSKYRDFHGRENGLKPSGLDFLIASFTTSFAIRDNGEFLGTICKDILYLNTLVPPFMETFDTNLLYDSDFNHFKKTTHKRVVSESELFHSINWIIVPSGNSFLGRSHMRLLIGYKQNNAFHFWLCDSAGNPIGTHAASVESVDKIKEKFPQFIFTLENVRLFHIQNIFASGHGFAPDRRCGLHSFALAYFFTHMEKSPHIVANFEDGFLEHYREESAERLHRHQIAGPAEGQQIPPQSVLLEEINLANTEDIRLCANMVFQLINFISDEDLQYVLRLGIMTESRELLRPLIQRLEQYCEEFKDMSRFWSFFSAHSAVIETREAWLPFLKKFIGVPSVGNQLAYLYIRMIFNISPRGKRAEFLRDFGV